MSFVDDLKNLDPSNPGLWPMPVKMLAFLAAFVAVLLLGWRFSISDMRYDLERLKEDEQNRIVTLEEKQHQAANLEPLKVRMKEMEQSFGEMIRQLPDRTAVESLLVDISQTGLAAGLEFKLFKPDPVIPAEFYSTLPINIQVYGSYHEMGEFISGLAALPRIVTIHDVKITSQPTDVEKLLLVTTARTYQTASTGEKDAGDG